MNAGSRFKKALKPHVFLYLKWNQRNIIEIDLPAFPPKTLTYIVKFYG